MYLGEKILDQVTETYNVESIQYLDVLLTIWDVAGKNREHLEDYFPCEALIFVIDSTNKEKLSEAANLFKEVIKIQMTKNDNKVCPVAIVSTKQDVTTETRIQMDEIKKEFDLETYEDSNKIFEVSSTEGLGTSDIIEWLGEEMKKFKDLEPKVQGVYDFLSIKKKNKK